MKNKKIALVGNPNSGKTTIFNSLTGLSARAGNYSGVTFNLESGIWETTRDEKVDVIDFPGTYSLQSAKEGVNFNILEELHKHDFDCVINVLDALSLQRNLYLTYQLREQGIPVIVVVNRIDLAEKHGYDIDVSVMSKALNCPVIAMCACSGKDYALIEDAIENYTFKPFHGYTELNFWKKLQFQFQQSGCESLAYSDLRTLEMGQFTNAEFLKIHENPISIEIADLRYQEISNMLSRCQTIHRVKPSSITRKIDHYVLDKYLGIPIFFLIMYGLFTLTVKLGGIFQILVDAITHALLVDGVYQLFITLGIPNWVANFLGNGLGLGIATTLTFTPVLFCMFFGLGWLEHSGYMARAAFLLDHLMRKIGLPGRAMASFIIGFGCNVPSVLSTRILGQPQERLMTIMMAPFMSCGARLTIYAVMVTAFFPLTGHNIIFVLYLIGILASVLTGMLLQPSLDLEEPLPLIMEMPAYQWPNLKILVRAAIKQSIRFIERAARYIIPLTAVLTLLMHFDSNLVFLDGLEMEGSVLAYIAKAITYLFLPMGISVDNWQATVGLIAGLLAKEVVVGTMNTLYAQVTMPTTPILQQIHEGWVQFLDSFPHLFANSDISVAATNFHHLAYSQMVERFGSSESAFAFLVFALLYFPCMSTIAAISKEASSKWAILSLVWSTVLAYLMGILAYQSTTFAQHPFASMMWIGWVLLTYMWTVNVFQSRSKTIWNKYNDTQSNQNHIS